MLGVGQCFFRCARQPHMMTDASERFWTRELGYCTSCWQMGVCNRYAVVAHVCNCLMNKLGSETLDVVRAYLYLHDV